MNTQTPERKKLVYGGLKGLDNHIARLAKSGWKVVRTEIIKWANGTKSFIAELENDNKNRYAK